MWEQADILAQMAECSEKLAGVAMKFVNAMELFTCGDHYMWMWKMGRSGMEQDEVPLKLFWKDRRKEAGSGNGQGLGVGESENAEATLQ